MVGLEMFNSILEAIPFLLQTAPAVRAGYKGVNLKGQKQAAGQMNQLAAQQAKLAAAQTDMNNSLFQNLYQQNRAQGQQDLASTISELSRQNRKLTTMGRRPLLDQERGGESIFRNLIKDQQDVGNSARTNTFSQLLQGQNALGGAQGAYSNIYDAEGGLAKQRFSNDLLKVGANYTLGDAFKNLFGLNNQNTTQLRNGETINWRTPRFGGI